MSGLRYRLTPRLAHRVAGARCRHALVGLLVVLLPGASPAQQPPAPVVVVIAQEHTLSPVTWYPGSVISRNHARLAAEVAGRLEWVAEIGTVVEAGEPVFRIDKTLLEKQVAEDRAEIAREDARLIYLRKEVDRLQSLIDKQTVPRSQLDQAIANRGVTRAELAAARARLALSTERLARTEGRAPFSGVVTERLSQAGEWAESGRAVVRLVDSLSLEVQAWVPVNALAFIAQDSVLALEANPGEANGTVRTIVPVGEDRSRLYELRIGIDGTQWPAGQTLRVAVPTAEPRKVIAVPRDALVLRREGTTVFRVIADNVAEPVTVNLGIASGALIEVSGIKAGDMVVVRGGERLRPGQTVAPTEEAATQ